MKKNNQTKSIPADAKAMAGKPQLRFPEFSNEWERRNLSELVWFKNGKAHEQDIEREGKYVVINSKFISTSGRVKKLTNKQIEPVYVNDIVMVMSDVPNGRAIAKCYFVEENDKYTLNQRICALTAQNSIDPKFVYYIIDRNKYFLRYDNGVGQTNLRKDEVLKCPLNVPVTAEQQKIASFLSTVDKWIENLKQQKDALEQYKKGMMQKIFSQEVRFKDDDGNEFPEWEEKKLGDVATLKNGYAFKSNTYDQSGRYKVVTIGNVQNGKLQIEDIKRIMTLPDDISDYQILTEGDILISMTGNVGRVCKVTEHNCLLNQRVGKLEFLKNIADHNFIYQLINSSHFEFRMQSYAQGGAQGNISRSAIEIYPFQQPTLEEQQKIARFLSGIEELIESKEQHISHAEQWKKGLLQKMFV